MKKLFNKYIYGIICTMLLLAAFGMGFLLMEQQDVYFYIDNGEVIQEIAIFDTEERGSFVFLPSYAEMKDVKIGLPIYINASIDDIPLESGMICDQFELEKDYHLTEQNGQCRNIRFVKSANVGTMYINTASGNMEYIHEDKDNVEYAEIHLLTQEGEQCYYSEGCTIKGRGNATWMYDKRPYVISLQNGADLLGMGTAQKWILLANATDEINLNNKLVYDFAREIGNIWVPECEYVDVYLNGVYNGLYLLCEKLEAGENRLDIDMDSGDFLCRTELNSRWDILKNPLLTASGRAVEISESGRFEADIDLVKNQINIMEDIIFSGTDLSKGESIDEQSWINRYLIDEIFGNIDSDLCSSYFFRKDDVFYAGPVWDYDMILGNSHRNRNADAFIAKNRYKTTNGISLYYDALYKNEFFYSHMVEAYRERFLPALQHLTESGVRELSQRISAASMMNSLRWKEMYDYIFEYESVYKTTMDSILNYLHDRIQFLNSVWIDGEEFCTVQYLPSDHIAYASLSVKPGTILTADMLGFMQEQWEELQKKVPFDLNEPVTEDIVLDKLSDDGMTLEPENQEEDFYEERPVGTQDYITVASVAIMIVFLVFLSVIAIRNQSKERRKSDARTGTKVSS